MNEDFTKLLQALVDGKVLQRLLSDETTWMDTDIGEALTQLAEIQTGYSTLDRMRIKPATILINNIEVPAPESSPLTNGQTYYTPSYDEELGYFTSKWWNEGDWYDLLRLKRKQIWVDKLDIQEVVKAMGLAK